MPEESKPVAPGKEDGVEESRRSANAAGKQPAVDSDDDGSGVDEAGDDNDGRSATSPSKKKKSKRKKIKEALTRKSADPEADIKKAIASLPPGQLAELLKQNPALAQEISGAQAEGSSGGPNTTAAIEALKRLSLTDIMTGLASSGKNAKDMGSYKFWQTQPVPKFGETGASGPFEEGPFKVQTLDNVPKELPKMVDGFEWDTLDLTKSEQVKEVYELLNGHYVEDDSAMFRFKYSPSILKWAMMSPGWLADWHVGVRATQSRKLVAFISAIPLELRVRANSLHASEVNFLVIHKKLRAKRLTPVLIKEITRRINLQGIWQAVYTAGIVLPKPVSTCRYFHRALNWQKLYEVGFCQLPANSKPQYQLRKYALPDQTSTKGVREMQEKDLDSVHKLLARYLKRYDMAPEYSKEEWGHWLLDKKDATDERVIFSYVVEDEKKAITDFFSFFALDSSVINNPRHDIVRAAYLFYYATEIGLATPFDKSALKKRLNELMKDAMIVARGHRFDVFNALSVMDNALFLEEQKFGAGDGQLHYYLFNYRANPIAGGVNKRNELDEDTLSGVGLTML